MLYSFKFAKQFIFENSRRYILGAITSILENLMIAVPTFLISIVVDALILRTLTIERLLFYFLIVVITAVISYFAGYYWTVAIYGSHELSQKYYQDRFVKDILNKGQVFFEKFSVGDLISRATLDVLYVSDLLSWGISLFFFSGSQIIIYLILMIQMGGWFFTLITLIPYIILLILTHLEERVLEKRWLARQKAFSEMSDKVLEGVEGVRNIRAFAQERAFRDRFRKRTNDFSNLAKKVSSLSLSVGLMTNIAALIVFIITIAYGTNLVNKGVMSVGNLISFQIFVTSLSNPIVHFAMNFNVIQNANTSARRLQELADADDGMEKGSHEPDRFNSLEVKDYTFFFPGADHATLNKVNAQLSQGETLGLVGKTGGGKSSFLRQLLREYPAGEGTFAINGIPLSDIKSAGLHKILGFVSQEHYFFSGSIRDNVKFAVPDASDEEILEALTEASFILDSEVLREGLDTLIGEKGVTLSGGQRQRLSIARAILKNPEVLVLDDSLSAVDAITERTITKNLERLRKNKTTIISSHRLSAVQDADEILVFDEGKIVERGTHAELMAKDTWYKEQFIHQERSEL